MLRENNQAGLMKNITYFPTTKYVVAILAKIN